MDIEYYRNFIAIVDAGSISAAAKNISIAQPALSNQLKTLQKKYGTTLLNVKRGGHSIELTDAGCMLYNAARYICSAEASVMKEISDCNAGFSGTLRISLSPSMSISFIRNYLSAFSKQYPRINYELYEVPISEQTEQLLNGKTEIGVANAPLLQENRFETIYRRKEQLMALFHKDSPYLENEKPNILLDDLEDVPLCLSRGCSDLFLNVCSDSRIFPQVLSINTTKTSTMIWASENAGIAIIPASSEEIFPPELVCKTIKDERLFLDKTLSIVKGRPLSSVAKLFLSDFIKQI